MYQINVVIFLLSASWLGLTTSVERHERKFSDSFRFGVATASYQIEGAWNVSDKSESVWDHFTHYQKESMTDNSTGDVACDSYHLYKRDVEMLVELGVSFYRFSISWTRLLPTGFSRKVSEDGLRYYNNLIDELIRYNITPMVTIFHWDTPQVFQNIGGWTNDLMVDFYADYARVVFENFGDRVKEWITFNEPFNFCLYGYGTKNGFLTFAPDIGFSGVAEYQCGHNVLKAHAKAYHIYNDTFKSTQKGRVGMANLLLWSDPESDSARDIQLSEDCMQFYNGWFYHPILTKYGDYPKVMRDNIARVSAAQGFTKSRLPKFTEEERLSIIGTCDFLGINFYTSTVVNGSENSPNLLLPSYINDLGHNFYQRPEWEQAASSWLKLHPEGLKFILNWAKKQYGDLEMYITEIGFSSKGGLNDLDRISFFNKHLESLLDAIDDGCNVTAFTAWSLMDNFEWTMGYTEQFGLYQVDFKSPNKTRTARAASLVYKNIIETRALNYSFIPYVEDPMDINISYKNTFISLVALVIGIIVLTLIIVVWNNRRKLFNRKPDRWSSGS